MRQILDIYHPMSFGSSPLYVHSFHCFNLGRLLMVNFAKVEMGSKNHDIVPTPLIVQISGLRNGGVNKLIGSLAKRNLVSKVQNSKCMLTPVPSATLL